MEKIGSSSLYVEKYRPQCFDDIIATEEIRKLLQEIKSTGVVPNMIFSGPPGISKTTIALCIAKELGIAELHRNCSMDRGIDDMRYEVQGYATSSPNFMTEDDEGNETTCNTKLAILDEMDRLTPDAIASLKGLVEQVEDLTRFIFITNNFSKLASTEDGRALIDRCDHYPFGNMTKEETKDVTVQAFKRCMFILEEEEVEYDKKALGRFVKQNVPKFRHIIKTLQKQKMTFGVIDENIANFSEERTILDLVDVMKGGNWYKVRKASGEVNWDGFYTTFYNEVATMIDDDSKNDFIFIIETYMDKHVRSLNPIVTGNACLLQLMENTKWVETTNNK